tara:strand:+ start:22224 stop:22715 length:492 start_codon:yes stop_codon:yes gene_type:complete
MSYDIIKSISIVHGEVMVTSACSNVIPKTYSPFHCKSLTNILNEKGRSELDKVVFEEFRNGNFQGMSTPYAKALAWKSQTGLECTDGKLLNKFKKAWNENQETYALFNGYPVTSNTRRHLRYSYSTESTPKYFKNMTQAQYHLSNHEKVTFHLKAASKTALAA